MPVTTTQNWFVWALLSAVIAALTATFAKVGLEGVNSDFATLIRTFVILFILAAFVFLTDKWINPLTLGGKTCGKKLSAPHISKHRFQAEWHKIQKGLRHILAAR